MGLCRRGFRLDGLGLKVGGLGVGRGSDSWEDREWNWLLFGDSEGFLRVMMED